MFLCISLRSNSAFLPVYCWPCNFVYDVFVAGGFSYTLYSDSGSPSPFLFMVITREHFLLALGELLPCFFVWACMLVLQSVFFEVRAFVKWSEKFVEPQLAIKNFCVFCIGLPIPHPPPPPLSFTSTLRIKSIHYCPVGRTRSIFSCVCARLVGEGLFESDADN